MSIQAVKGFFRKYSRENDILEFKTSSATVELAAQAAGVIPARIAKTLSFMGSDCTLLIVTAGDSKIDNTKFKTEFGFKAKMLSAEEVVLYTGHEIGGVCPFALTNSNLKVFLDISLKRFTTVYPACGSSNSAIELSCNELEEFSGNTKWIDVCKGWQCIFLRI